MTVKRYLGRIVKEVQQKVKGIVDVSEDNYAERYWIVIRNGNFIFKTEVGEIIDVTHYRMKRSLGDKKFDSETVVNVIVSAILEDYRNDILDNYFK